MNLQVTVTDPELIASIKAWEDGSNYTLTVTQDAPMQFTATAAEEAMEEPEAEADEAPEKEVSTEMANKAPGLALLIAKPAK